MQPKVGDDMKYFSSEKYTALGWLWLLLISAFTVLKIAPDGLNADILINSVMSLQNITLYYWGQNRLLNVLPFAVALIKNPTLNLAVILALTSLSFYGLLYLLSHATIVVLRVENKSEIAFKVFLITSSVFVLIFSPHAISEISIGHIEYSFSALLLVFAGLKLLSEKIDLRGWQRLVLPVSALILAIGLNPSTVIPAVFISFAGYFYIKKIRVNEILLLLVSVAAFFSWNFVSKQYGNLPYNKFSLETFYAGLQKVVVSLVGAVNLTSLIFIIGIVSIWNLCVVLFGVRRDNERQSIISYITNATILFSVCWLALFASSRWVEMNNFAWRYFIFVLFSLIFSFAFRLAGFLDQLTSKCSSLITALAVLVVAPIFVSPLTKVSFNDYKVFQRVNSLTEPGGHLYSGDYWVVWPSVLRDMMRGYEAYGLTYRGDANRISARDFVLGQINEDGYSQIYCLNDSVMNCIAQANAVAGPLFAVSSNHLKDGVYLIKVSSSVSSLDFSGSNFISLPSQVGNVGGLSIATKSKSGFLIYGPYVPLKAGKYYLSVNGQATRLVSAYVDVVSDKGAKVHARVDLSKSTNSFLVDKFEVNLPPGINDLEVRVWVGEGDEITLHGYSLKPH